MSTTIPARPAVTPELLLQAARKVCERARWSEEQAEAIADVYEQHMDGYQLAKALEDRHFWDITADDVAELDGMGTEVDKLHREACIAWAREHDIQPPLAVGTLTTRGEITGIYEHDAAMYLIREPGAPDSRRLLIRFEDAKAAPVVA